MSIIQGLIGFMLLSTGGQLYWFFAGVVAFLIGDFVAIRFFNFDPGADVILIGLGSAAIGILLTITARKPAMILIGFLAGVLAASTLPELFNWAPEFNLWYLLIAGGVLGGLFVFFAYSYAVVLLSAIIGAQLIAVSVHLAGVDPLVMFLAVLVLGIGVQLLLAQYAPPSLQE